MELTVLATVHAFFDLLQSIGAVGTFALVTRACQILVGFDSLLLLVVIAGFTEVIEGTAIDWRRKSIRVATC